MPTALFWNFSPQVSFPESSMFWPKHPLISIAGGAAALPPSPPSLYAALSPPNFMVRIKIYLAQQFLR